VGGRHGFREGGTDYVVKCQTVILSVAVSFQTCVFIS